MRFRFVQTRPWGGAAVPKMAFAAALALVGSACDGGNGQTNGTKSDGGGTTTGDPPAYTAALAEGASVPIHPDCVAAMSEVPYAFTRRSDEAERQMAEAVRKRIPTPPASSTGHVVTADGKRVDFTYETRETPNGIRVGMMIRKRFDGPDRGMLFVYPVKDYRHYWMRNCFIPIDLAYLRAGKIDQIFTMTPQAGKPQKEMPRYNSESAVRYVLEMPSGWFGSRSIRKGDRIELR